MRSKVLSSPVAAPALLAAVLSAGYLAWAPSSQDLAAATFRADLFADHGFVVFNNAWYSGHYLLSYSVLYPPLGALLGPRLTAALSVVAAAALFGALAQRAFGRRALVPSLWFAVAACAWLLTGRVPFLLALPFGLGALLAADRSPLGAAALGAATSLASPVGGLFLIVAGGADALAGQRRRGIAPALGALVPIAVLNVAFPTGGVEPFVFSALIAVPLLAALVWWLVDPELRALRIGAALYAALAIVAYLHESPLGGNVTRMGALFAGPVLALALWPRGVWVVLAVSVPLAYWQLVAPVRDVRKATGDPSIERAYYGPLLAELDRLAADGAGGERPLRVEVPPTKNRFEAAYVAPEYPIARGWLRQLESEDRDLFTDGSLSAEAYGSWLREHGVSLVAVPDAPRDYMAEDEVELIDGGLPYLRPVWSSPDWRLYAVAGSDSWGLDGLGVSSLGPDGFELEAATPGDHRTSITWTPYWHVDGGDACLLEADDGTTVVRTTRPDETVRVGISLSGSGC